MPKKVFQPAPTLPESWLNTQHIKMKILWLGGWVGRWMDGCVSGVDLIIKADLSDCLVLVKLLAYSDK